MEDFWIITILTILTIIFGLYIIYNGFTSILLNLAGKTDFSKWADTEKDKVILHIVRGKTVPSISPYGIKLETYLRMTNIDHEVEISGKMGPKGKTPWISLNGQHMGDSQLIIDFLAKKFSVEVDKDFSQEQLANAYFIRTAFDEHFYWGILLWRWATKEGVATIEKILALPAPVLWVYKKLFPRRVKEAGIGQGLGRHTPQELNEIFEKELKTISGLIGDKKYLLGNEPCTEDCTIFGHLAEVLWAMPGNPHEPLFKGECKNLKMYCERMKNKFYPDWESILAK